MKFPEKKKKNNNDLENWKSPLEKFNPEDNLKIIQFKSHPNMKKLSKSS